MKENPVDRAISILSAEGYTKTADDLRSYFSTFASAVEPPPQKNSHTYVHDALVSWIKEPIESRDDCTLLLSDSIHLLSRLRSIVTQTVEQEDDIKNNIIHDIIERKHMGIKKYGVALQPHNGRNAAVDAYQEVLDLCIYLMQLKMEKKG